MAARWIGLVRPHRPRAAPARRNSKTKHPLDRTLRGFGAACVLGAGFLFNWALFPEASGYANALIGTSSPLAQAAAPAPAVVAPALIDEAEVRLLAATAWGEARSEGEDGMRAVAHVMVNRVGNRFGDDLKTVILAPKQFSAWNRGDPNRPLVQNPERYARAGSNQETWETAQEVAREVLSGQSVDPTNGALFYHTRAIRPWWSAYGEGRQVIGAHVFYRDVPAQYRAEHPRMRVTRTAAASPGGAQPAEPRGRRAGRVNGVIQYAPAEAPGAVTAPASARAPSAPNPELAAAMAQLPSSTSF